jgi:pectinesterase
VDGQDIQLSNFTINNDAIGQAEALMTRGERIVLSDMTLNGSGDALTTYGTLYVQDSKLAGHGDTILGYAAAYFLRTELVSIGPFSWTRTPAGQHGNVFVDCTFIANTAPPPWAASASAPVANPAAVLARLPRNNSATRTATNFPHAEMVLIDSRLHGVPPEGWGPVEAPPGFDSSQVRFWEFNSRDLQGKPVDVSRRHPVARRLTMEKDAALIADYRRPEFVLGGWQPVVLP